MESHLFSVYTVTDEELISATQNWIALSEEISLNDEEIFTLKSINKSLKTFLIDDDISQFESTAQEAHLTGYHKSTIDILLFKGILVNSLAFSGTTRIFKIENTRAVVNKLEEIETKDNIYYELLKALLLFYEGQEKESIPIFQKLRTQLDMNDCSPLIVVYYLLIGMYHRNPSKQIVILEEGLKGNCFYWEFVVKYLVHFFHRGKYIKTQELALDYLEEMEKDLDDYMKGIKLSILDQLIKSAFRLNLKCDLQFYLSEYTQTLDSLPYDEYGNKYNYQLFNKTNEILFKIHFSEKKLTEEEIENFLKFGENSFFNMLMATVILNPIINSMVLEKEYDRAFYYIQQLDNGKGYSKSSDKLISFLESFYISALIDRTLRWQKYNILEYNGSQTEIALKYLKDSQILLDKGDESLKVSALLHEVNLRLRADSIDQLEESYILETLKREGYDYVLALMIALVYYISTYNKERYYEIKYELFTKLEEFSGYNFYEQFKLQVNSLCSYFEVNLSIEVESKRTVLDFDLIQDYTQFLQHEINKVLTSS